MHSEDDKFNILEKIKARDDFASIAKPYSLPYNYLQQFEGQLADFMNSGKKLAGLNSTTTLSKPYINPYKIPEGYFNQVEATIQSKINHRHGNTLLFKKWYKIAVAACLAGVLLSLGIWYFQSGNKSYGNVKSADLKLLSNEELSHFVEVDSNINNVSVSGKNVRVNSVDFNQLFNNLSTHDLELFLNDTQDDDTGNNLLN